MKEQVTELNVMEVLTGTVKKLISKAEAKIEASEWNETGQSDIINSDDLHYYADKQNRDDNLYSYLHMFNRGELNEKGLNALIDTLKDFIDYIE